MTLTGVGGVGKTRLALQVAAEVLPRFREGAWLVELAAVRDPDGGGRRVRGDVRCHGPGGPDASSEALVEFLRTKQLLLVVDNCEHLLGAVADLVEVLERSCAGVVVLATSREGLARRRRARGARSPSLAGPDDGRRSRRDRRVRTRCSCSWSGRRPRRAGLRARPQRTRAAVVQVCRRLDGVPLAIELAAARVADDEPGRAARRRWTNGSGCSTGGRRGAVERHQTLRATIDWSYELLASPNNGCWPASPCSPVGAPSRRPRRCASVADRDRAVFGLLRGSGGPIAGGRRARWARYPLPAVGDDPRVRRGTSRRPRRDRWLRDRHAEYYREFAACRLPSELGGATPDRSRAGASAPSTRTCSRP